MNKKTNTNTIANFVTMAGVTGMLLIAGFSLPISLTILGSTAVGCAYLTVKQDKEGK